MQKSDQELPERPSFNLNPATVKAWTRDCTQRAQYPLIKEYSLNHNVNPLLI